jgi:hypothetical protein
MRRDSATYRRSAARGTDAEETPTRLQAPGTPTGLVSAPYDCGTGWFCSLYALAGRRRAPMLYGIAAALLVAGAVGGGGFAGMRLIAVVLAERGGPEEADTWTAVQTGSPFLVLAPLVLLAALGTFVGAAAVVRARADIAVWVSVLGEVLALAALVPVARAALRA